MGRAEYLEFSCVVGAYLEDDIPEILTSSRILGCHVVSLSAAESEVRVYVEAGSSEALAKIAAELESRGARGGLITRVGDQDWLAPYREQVVPFEVGATWWVDPHPGHPSAAPDGRTRLVMEPRMAFGSGSHETTRLMLEELERVQLRGRSVLDVGTGSGILAMAADCLGARVVVGLDVDVQAIFVARQLARQQEWDVAARFLAATPRALGRCGFDLVVCNMIPANFQPLLPDISTLVARGGLAVFSGILAEQDAAVRRALGAVGLEPREGLRMGEWISLRAVHRGPA
jgi:ribosomal protein L11 methyltransferase